MNENNMQHQNKDNLSALRHSAEHVLMQAMIKLYPDIKMAMGPATDEGFYFDFDLEQKISLDDFLKIEDEMQKIIKDDLPFCKKELTICDAKKLFSGNEYKQEWLCEIKKRGEKATVFYTGDEFVDLCAGPHVKSTGVIGAFKLTKVAGAYWHGDEKNKMLQRIYGVAFEKENELKEYLLLLKEAGKRDHRKIGAEQELFIIDDEVGQGLILWLPKGATLYNITKNFAYETYLRQGYDPVITPHIASTKLWSRSGHMNFYKESLYPAFNVEDEEYMLKPMNCPLHVRMYKNKKRSYRDLPIRWTEMGTVYRYERSGTLHGLTRVRGFTQDDAHIICAQEQLEEELKKAFELTLYILNSFGFQSKNIRIDLSARDPKNKDKFAGNDKDWARAEKILQNIVKTAGFDIKNDIGGAVFYGPKIDIKVKDAIGRPWQLSTIQFDFNLPMRFEMAYQGSDGKEHTPFMIHRALLGSLERFLGVLIEHYAGAFPLWLSPVQLSIISVGESHQKHCQKLAQEFKDKNLRIEVLDDNETVGNKIRKAISQKIPYMLVIGDKEINSDKLHIRKRGNNNIIEMSKQKFFNKIEQIIKNKSEEL
ncbi:threonine--tRNA ligase [Candidatus Kuenenbacteria bacterium CG08_land_8_20_14_0_20_37_23]|uniref:Threonine--tRNA ligase n=2 Tax=Candidatus Kueneniibacteriota TaxID=1752740 RepID=A0A2M6XSN1_9BACT|nr:MAG: threonine--tRNA ligase [Candidatus Kuenenbacteria bacterium CG08_land_8_20_14_0_20_37_23]